MCLTWDKTGQTVPYIVDCRSGFCRHRPAGMELGHECLEGRPACSTVCLNHAIAVLLHLGCGCGCGCGAGRGIGLHHQQQHNMYTGGAVKTRGEEGCCIGERALDRRGPVEGGVLGLGSTLRSDIVLFMLQTVQWCDGLQTTGRQFKRGRTPRTWLGLHKPHVTQQRCSRHTQYTETPAEGHSKADTSRANLHMTPPHGRYIEPCTV